VSAAPTREEHQQCQALLLDFEVLFAARSMIHERD
jgi:hypothetical protein